MKSLYNCINLEQAAYCGIFTYTLGALGVFSDTLNLVSILLGIFYLFGFLQISDKTKNSFLKAATWTSIGFGLLGFLFLLGLDFLEEIVGINETVGLIFALPAMPLQGIVCIFWGVGILKLKKDFGDLALVTGILNILVGALYVTIIGALLAIFLWIPMAIFEVLLLFKAAEKYKIQRRPHTPHAPQFSKR